MPSTLAGSCGKRVSRNAGSSASRCSRVEPVEVREEVLDEDLAAELLAEELDVGADDRPEVEQRRAPGAAQRREELPQRLGGHRRPRARPGPEPARLGSSAARRGARRDRNPVTLPTPDKGSVTWNARGRAGRAATGRPTPAGEDGRGYRLPALRLGAAAPARPAGLAAVRRPASAHGLPPRPCAACRRCRGSARPRQSPRAATTMSPSTEPLSRMSTFSVARDVAGDLAEHDDRLGEHLRLDPAVAARWSARARVSSILPSTCPSIVRSSLPFSSPLMTTDLPMFTMSLASMWRLLSSSGPCAAGAAGVAVGVAGTAASRPVVGRTFSSRFHMMNLRLPGPLACDEEHMRRPARQPIER